jgi:transcriptional regulator with XRE-family HTH domain
MLEGIGKVREEVGLSQAEVALRTGKAQVQISRMESGKNIPRVDTLAEVLRALDHELMAVPRELVPVVHAMIRERRSVVAGAGREGASQSETKERPVYQLDEG